MFLPSWPSKLNLYARKISVRVTKLPRDANCQFLGGLEAWKTQHRNYNAFPRRYYTVTSTAIKHNLVLYTIYLLALSVCCLGRCTAAVAVLLCTTTRYRISTCSPPQVLAWSPHRAYSSKDQPGKVANSGRGQLNRENEYFPVSTRA